MRIVRVRWKIAYFAITSLVGFALVRLLEPVLPPVLLSMFLGVANAATYLGASRSFRVHGEPVSPPRMWWRMTGRPRASGVIAILQLWSILGSVSSLDEKDGVALFVVNATVSIVFAALFFNSWVRLRREKPAGWALPSSAAWHPAPLPRALR